MKEGTKGRRVKQRLKQRRRERLYQCSWYVWVMYCVSW